MLIKTPCFELRTMYLHNFPIYTYIIEFPKVTTKHREHIIRCIFKHLEKTNRRRFSMVMRDKAVICIMPIKFNPEQSIIQKPFVALVRNFDVKHNVARMAINAIYETINSNLVINKLDMFYITNKLNQIGFGIGGAPVKRKFEELKIENAYNIMEMDLN